MSRTALLLLAHGSRQAESNRGIYQLVEALREQSSYLVEAGFLELNPPDFETVLEACIVQGAERVIVVPYFLLHGTHVRQDIPEKCVQARERYPEVDIQLAEALGFHPLLVDIVLDRARSCCDRAEVP